MSNFQMLISPSKSLSEIENNRCEGFSTPYFLDRAVELVAELKQLPYRSLEEMLGVSSKIAMLNWERYQQWATPFNLSNSRRAILTFSGDVYGGLMAKDFEAADFDYSQEHLRILSGLYGLLRPLDLIQPYRLEMGASFKVQGQQSLYSFWSRAITAMLNSEVEAGGVLVNLASSEYFRVVDLKQLAVLVITVEFRENRPDGYKVVPIFAKRARGLMSRFAIKRRLTDVDDLKLFDTEEYMYSEPLSTSSKWVFVR